jgi:hypothetical protein
MRRGQPANQVATATPLHECRDAADFLSRFEGRLGTPVRALVDRFVDRDRLAAVILAGSIPLGLGTRASDIDLIVIVDSHEPIAMPAVDPGQGVVFAGAFTGDARLDVGEVILTMDDVQVDLHYVAGPRVAHAAAALAGGTVSLTEHEIGVLSRIKTGWVLDRRPAFDEHCSVLLADDSLEIRTATWHLVGALQELADARAALADSVPLALYLGRRCVEKSFAAFFAGRGFAYLGGKWLRALEAGRERTPWSVDDGVRAVCHEGTALLFPTPAGDEAAAGYVDRVARFIDLVRTETEKRLPFKVAFALCPQLHPAGQ